MITPIVRTPRSGDVMKARVQNILGLVCIVHEPYLGDAFSCVLLLLIRCLITVYSIMLGSVRAPKVRIKVVAGWRERIVLAPKHRLR